MSSELLARCVFVSALLGTAAFAPPLEARQRQTAPATPLEQLAKWVERLQRSSELTRDEFDSLRALVGELRTDQVLHPEARLAALPALLDLASLEPRRFSRDPRHLAHMRTMREQASELGFQALDGLLMIDAPAAYAWLANELLGQPERHPLARRRAGLELMRTRREPTLLVPILSSARDADRSVRDAAMAALAGWDDVGVHRFMLQQLERVRSDRGWVSITAVLEHFEGAKIAADSEFAGALRAYCQGEVMSEDWRRAVAGTRLLAVLTDELAVPVLIEGLSLWVDRRTTEGGRKRVEGDFERELRRRSGRNLGLYPDRWARWWRAKTAGGSQAPAEEGGETVAGFFGLRPWTDRVVFVIDRSGSMKAGFRGEGSTGTVSRYAEALRQMESLLASLGPETRFRIVLFDSQTHVWRDKLSLASKASLTAARSWCTGQTPDGGTSLRLGIDEVLRLDRAGEPNLARIEEDTVIVLCDGQTAEGSSWVRPLLDRTGPQTGLVFHCVQIGTTGDDTLKQLAELSGGEFVQIDG